MKNNENIYHFDYSGQCDPATANTRWKTFSVGVFVWLPKASGRGLKKSKAVKRIIGQTKNPESAYAEAQAYCAKMQKTV